MLFSLHWSVWLAWLLAVAFIGNGVANWIGLQAMRDGYSHWGYPDWFHRVSGALQVGAGALLTLPPTRLAGIALAMILCLGLFATLLRRRERRRLPRSILVFALLCLDGWGAVLLDG